MSTTSPTTVGTRRILLPTAKDSNVWYHAAMDAIDADLDLMSEPPTPRSQASASSFDSIDSDEMVGSYLLARAEAREASVARRAAARPEVAARKAAKNARRAAAARLQHKRNVAVYINTTAEKTAAGAEAQPPKEKQKAQPPKEKKKAQPAKEKKKRARARARAPAIATAASFRSPRKKFPVERSPKEGSTPSPTLQPVVRKSTNGPTTTTINAFAAATAAQPPKENKRIGTPATATAASRRAPRRT
ncbi:hypothetical protein EDC01DRAFT_744397 [Geopyxis carbonaria]|nr:hypothetical protein EDC01DRAFT_744397 [Geopyxis carbonaria]